MENPFEQGHIKNYLLFYTSIVVIVILFFIASSLFFEVEDVEKKVFTSSTKIPSKKQIVMQSHKEKDKIRKFKLLDKAY